MSDDRNSGLDRGDKHVNGDGGTTRPKRSRDRDQDRRQPKIMSKIVAVMKQGESGQHDRWMADTPSIETPKQQDAYMKPEIVKRDKRMFSALMGHLGRASTSLKDDATIIEKQDKRRELATKKNKMESSRVAEIQKRVSMEERDKELNLRDMVAAKKEKQDLAASTAVWKAQVSKLEKYLMTNEVPHLAWLPVVHNEKTSEAMANRHQEICDIIAKREVADKERVREIDAAVADKEEKRREARMARVGSASENIGNRDHNSDTCEQEEEDHPRKKTRAGTDKEALLQSDDAAGAYCGDESAGPEDEEDDDILAALDGRYLKDSQECLDENHA